MYAALALLSAVPRAALAQNSAVTVTVPTGQVAAGATVPVDCYAQGRVSGSSTSYDVLSIGVTADAGSVSPQTISGTTIQTACVSPMRPTDQCYVLQGTVNWTLPAAPGTYTVTCSATIHPIVRFGQPPPDYVEPGSASLTTVASAVLPPISSAISGPSQVVVGQPASFSVTASDPNDPPQALTYEWTATGGTITPDAASPWTATWQAPADPGAFEISVTVRNESLSVQVARTVAAVLALPQQALAVSVDSPRRLAVAATGEVFVVDATQGSIGTIVLATRRGDTRGFATVPENTLAVASGGGFLWVTTAPRMDPPVPAHLYRVDPFSGRTLEQVPLADSLGMPMGIAWEPSRSTLWVVDNARGLVRIVRPDGTVVRTIADAGGASLAGAYDVAIDTVNGRAWVLRLAPPVPSSLEPGENPANARFLHAFDLDGNYLASYEQTGVHVAARAGGVAVAAGRIYVSDTFDGVVHVFDGANLPVSNPNDSTTWDLRRIGTIGTWGSGSGQLKNPAGLAVLANGDLAVANVALSRVDRFGSGAALPTCAGDTDCDGLPDAWEQAQVPPLDLAWAGDALLDSDGDGLNNAEELALGTNPRSRDTDGDGYPDGDEVLAGTDPLDPNDHRAVVVASGPSGEVGPGLVKMYATVSAPASCATPELAWTQHAGPPVTIGGAATTSATAVVRAAGAYAFDAVVTCQGVRSAPSRVTVTVHNVAPVADAGRILVSQPGEVLRLDGLFSSDANGEAITAYEWDQTLGQPISGAVTGSTFAARARGPGLYKFQLTTTDPTGASSAAEVPVLVAAGPVATAVAVAVPTDAEVGQVVTLDGSASVVPGNGAGYTWTQLSGPATVDITGWDDQPLATFTPPQAGRYAFDLTVADGNGRRESPPARVEVFVAEAGGVLPEVRSASAAASVVAVGSPVELTATGTGTALAWRQLSGPAAGLTDGDAATATVVPFAAGHHVFEVVAKDGDAESHPARVAFEARAGGKAIPVARVSVPGQPPVVGQLVFLDGSASTGAARFRWTQTAGPWVVLSSQSSVTSFRPTEPGTYAFELEVDDGAAAPVRSAPARVEVIVSEKGVR